MSTLRVLSLGVAFALELGLTACAPTVSNHGFQVSDIEPKMIKVGQDSKSSVLEKLGSPSTISTFEPNIWFYMSQKDERLTYHDPEVKARDMTVITFDKASEKVTEVRSLSMAEARKVAFSRRETPTRGREMTVLEQIIGNVGRAALPSSEDQNTPNGRRRE